MNKVRQLLDGPAEDRGAALILVLFVVTVIGLASAALLTFSDTSVRTTVALRDQAGNTYNADGAAQVALNALSTGDGFAPGLFNNKIGTTCFGPDKTHGTLDLSDFYPGTSGFVGTAPSSASVTCEADPATGIDGTVVPITGGVNSPSQAILTLGPTSSGEDGVYIKALGGSPFMTGAVKSNSNINVVSGGSLQSTAAVTAFGLCSGSIVSTPSASCKTGTTLDDPGYASEATVVPEYQRVPDDVLASCPNGVVTFKPGYYDNAIALTALMTGNGPCGGSTWWFTHGTYYFDFHNNTNDSDVYRGTATGGGGSADQWGITRGNLVAGTPTDSDGNVIKSPGVSPVMPGSCQNPIRSTTNAGVQFIFGGDSQLALGGSADAEICGTYSATRPPIGVFGLRSGAATTTTLTGPSVTGTALKMSTLVSAGLFSNATAAKLVQPDANSATWPKTTATVQTSTITMSGYAPPSAIPAGSIVKTATVRVVHGNSKKYVTGTNKDKLTVTFTPKGVAGLPGPAIALTPTLPKITGLQPDVLPVQALNGTSTFANYVHDNGFTGADVAYTATLSHSGNENLDAIQIDISYVPPAFRSEQINTISSNCMKQAYTGTPSGGCAVLSTSALSNFSGDFYVQGTTYTPVAPIDLTLGKAAQQVLRFGVISRSLWIKQTGAFRYSGPVIGIPTDNPVNSDNSSPAVFLTVYVCPAKATSSCDTDPGAIKALRVKAMINDSAPTSSMTILGWSNLR